MNAIAELSKAKALLAKADLDEVLQIRDQATALETYLRAQRDGLDAMNKASQIKLRAERKAGELIAADSTIRRGGDPNSQHVSLADRGITHSQSSRWQAEARVPEDRFVQWVAELESEGEELTQAGLLALSKSLDGKAPAAAANTGEIEWYTPSEYIELARDVMGSIDLDPASSERANETVQATEFLTRADDGLAHEWHGNIWMNPPYAAGVVSQFTDHLINEVEAKRVKQAIVLLNNATDTQWFFDCVSLSDCACFKTGRIAFIGRNDKPVSGAAQGQVFLYFGRRVKRFANLFGSQGWIAEIRK